MPFYDLSLDELSAYRPTRPEPLDFDAFWSRTLTETRRHPLAVAFTPEDTGLRLIEAFDVTYAGYGGQPVKGWLILPRERTGPLPCVVQYVGYGGGRGLVVEWLMWAAAGYAHFVMDTRGQGSTWRTGDTPDVETEPSNPQHPGFMTRGVLSPDTYYYRRVYADAVRAVDAARAHPAVDPARVAVTGGSQGGGITLAVAGLEPTVRAVLPDVPFLCDFPEAVGMSLRDPYTEIARYCKIHRDKIGRVFETLAYFDGIHFAARAPAPALFSVGLMDEVCPPRTVYAAYNAYAGPKEMRVYAYNDHEGGGSHHEVEKLRFVGHVLPPDP